MPWIGGTWVPEREYQEDPRSAVVGLAGRRTPAPSVQRQQDAYGALRESQDYSTRAKIGNAMRSAFPHLLRAGSVAATGRPNSLDFLNFDLEAGSLRDTPPASFARNYVQAGLGPGNQPDNPLARNAYGNPFAPEPRSTASDTYRAPARGGRPAERRIENLRRSLEGDPSDANWDGDYGVVAQFNDRRTSFANALERFRQQEWLPYQEQIDDLKGEYLDRINQLQDELDGYQGGLAGTNAAYTEYANDANAILSEAAAVKGEPIPDGTTQPVADAYDNITGVMADTINRIGGSGNPALAQEMASQIGYMQDTITDAMAGNLMRQDELFDLASSQASALAHMAWKDDLYNAERARTEIEIDINKAIGDKQDQIDDSRQAMADAIAKIKDSYDPREFTPNELWNLGMNDYFDRMGLDPFQKEKAYAMWEEITSQDPQSMYDYNTFKTNLVINLNQENLMKAGLWDDVDGFLDGLHDERLFADGLDEVKISELKGRLEQMISSKDIVKMLRQGANSTAQSWEIMEVLGFMDLSSLSDTTLNFSSLDSPHYSALTNVWSERQNFESNYDQYLGVDADMMPGSISYSSDGAYAYPIAGQNWWSGGGFNFTKSDGRTHEGVDLHAHHGTPIVAAAAGWVEKAGRNDMGGWTVTIRDSQGFLHYYAHMDGPATVKDGDYVPVGRMIGRVGSSGNSRDRAAHLHYGIRDRNGRPINPTTQLRAVSTASGTRSPDTVRNPNYRWQPTGTTSAPMPSNTAV